MAHIILYNIRRATTRGVSHHQSEREILDYIYRRRRVDLSLSSIHVLFATLGKLYIILYTTKLCKAQTATVKGNFWLIFFFFIPADTIYIYI